MYIEPCSGPYRCNRGGAQAESHLDKMNSAVQMREGSTPSPNTNFMMTNYRCSCPDCRGSHFNPCSNVPEINPEWEKLGPEADIVFGDPLACVNSGPVPPAPIKKEEEK